MAIKQNEQIYTGIFYRPVIWAGAVLTSFMVLQASILISLLIAKHFKPIEHEALRNEGYSMFGFWVVLPGLITAALFIYEELWMRRFSRKVLPRCIAWGMAAALIHLVIAFFGTPFSMGAPGRPLFLLPLILPALLWRISGTVRRIGRANRP